MKRFFLLSLFLLLCAGTLHAQTITEKVAGMQRFPGFFPFYWDGKAGKIWLEIDKWNTEFLYVESLPAGIGSNDIGLDRGQLGNSAIVRFDRVGPRVLLVAPNYGFRALTNDPDARLAVREAFAESTLWGFDVAAEEGSRVLVDATNFYLRDVHQVSKALKDAKQGSYNVDSSRSAFYLPNTKNFPQNTEVETTLTFTGEPEGDFVREVVPVPQAITVRERPDHVSGFLFNQERAARLVQFHALDARNPGLGEVIDKILASTWKAPAATGYAGEIQHTVDMIILNNLMSLASGERALNQVRAIASLKLEQLKTWVTLQTRLRTDENRRAFLYYALEQIKRFQDDPKKVNLTRPQEPPAGQPIGMACSFSQ